MFGISILLLFVSIFHDLTAIRSGQICDTDLSLTFLVHRHGDRTPIKSLLNFSNNPEELDKLTEPYGYAQLDDVGVCRSYEIGKFIRRRYHDLLSPCYYRNPKVYVRSTVSIRTMLTALIAFTAYSDDRKNNAFKVITEVVTPKYDFNAFFVNCPVFINKSVAMIESYSPEMKNYSTLLAKLSSELNYNFTQKPLVVYDLYDLYSSQLSLGLPLSKTIQELLPEIEKAADKATDVTLGNEDLIPLQAGVLLHKFIEQAERVISGCEVPRLQLFSAHDYNVYSFIAITRAIPRLGFPKFGTIFALELRKVPKSGQYVVLPVYARPPRQHEIVLEIEGCGNPCDFYKFRNITSKYVLNIDDWRKKCKFEKNEKISDYIE